MSGGGGVHDGGMYGEMLECFLVLIFISGFEEKNSKPKRQGSHSDLKTWKTWKNGKAFSSQGKVREF